MKKILLLLMGGALIAVGIAACSTRNILVEEDKFVKNTVYNHPDIEHHNLQVGEHNLHYAINGDANKPAFVIIHGTPSSWEQYARLLLNETLLAQYRMVVIDRPGWGSSTLGQDQAITSFAEQARIIAVLLDQLRQQSNGQPIVIMGHSLGASLAPRIAMDYPELVDGMLLLAGTLDPQLASPRWYHYAAAAPLVKYVIGDSLHRSNQEMFALKQDIAEMDGRWHEIKAHTLAVQGMRDGLVSPANSHFIENTFDPNLTTVVRLNKDGHLFPMTRRDDVVDWALQVLAEVEGANHKHDVTEAPNKLSKR